MNIDPLTFIVLVDCDNISPLFWPVILKLIGPNAVVVGYGVAHSLIGWRRAAPNLDWREVCAGKNIADNCLIAEGKNFYKLGARNFLVCSSDADLGHLMCWLWERGAAAQRFQAKDGIPRVVDKLNRRVLAPALTVMYRKLVGMGARGRWVPVRRMRGVGRDLNIAGEMDDLIEYLMAMGCNEITNHNGDMMVRVTGPAPKGPINQIMEVV